MFANFATESNISSPIALVTEAQSQTLNDEVVISVPVITPSSDASTPANDPMKTITDNYNDNDNTDNAVRASIRTEPEKLDAAMDTKSDSGMAAIME